MMAHIFVGHIFNREQIDDLRPAIRKGIPMAGAEIWFADEHPGTGSLYDKVTEGIDGAFACIFEMTDTTRANVFLELGFALAKQKPCVLICRKGTVVPVDLAGFERLEYESYANLTEQLKHTIGPRLGGHPISKGVILALDERSEELSRDALVREAMAHGAAQPDIATALEELARMQIISIHNDRIRVLNPNEVSKMAVVARQ